MLPQNNPRLRANAGLLLPAFDPPGTDPRLYGTLVASALASTVDTPRSRTTSERMARAWQAGAGRPPGRDLRTRLYRRPWLSPAWIAAGTGDLMARLREGRAFGALDTSCGRRWDGYATPEPGDNSRCGPTAVSIPTPSSPSAAGWMSASPSSASTPACPCDETRHSSATWPREALVVIVRRVKLPLALFVIDLPHSRHCFVKAEPHAVRPFCPAVR